MADVQALRQQVSMQLQSDAVAGDVPTEEQFDPLLASSTKDPSDAAM
jgi:hypothetical protein